MELQVAAGNGFSKIEVHDHVFGCDFKEALVHQVVNTYLAGGRQGTKAQKTRAEVRGGGRKPWRQKGSGRARAGTIRSPIWRGGGVTFAAEPRDHSRRLNKKMYKRGMSAILSELVRQGRLQVIEKFDLELPKTRKLLEKLKTLGITDSALIICDCENANVNLAARNLINVNVCETAKIDPVQLVSHEKVLITVDALKKIEERLS